MIKYAIAFLSLLVTASPAFAQASTCKFLCEPTLLIEPTVTWEKDATVFETIFALDLVTPIPRVGVTLEAITKPFSDENDVELESELKLCWLQGEQTGGWLSSHFDIVDKFSGAERPTDKRAHVMPRPRDAERPMSNAWGREHGSENGKRTRAKPARRMEARRVFGSSATTTSLRATSRTSSSRNAAEVAAKIRQVRT